MALSLDTILFLINTPKKDLTIAKKILLISKNFFFSLNFNLSFFIN